MDLVFALPDALLDRTLLLLDMGDLAHLRELSKAWQRRIAALPRFLKAHVLAVVQPAIMRLLADGEDAHVQLAKARLVSKAWFDAASAVWTGQANKCAVRDALARCAAMTATLPGQPLEPARLTRMSWLQ